MNNIEKKIIEKIISCKYPVGGKLNMRDYFFATDLFLQYKPNEVVEAIHLLSNKGLIKIVGEDGGMPIIELLYCSDDYAKYL